MLGMVRRVLVFVTVTIFVDAVLYGVITPLVPGYVDDYNLSKFRAGLIVGAFGGGVLLGAIPSGILAGRYGPKSAVVVGLLLLVLSSVTFGLAGSPLALGVSRFLQGISSTTTWAGALAWVTVLAPRERRGQVLGTVFGFAVLGAILGPTFGATAKLLGIRPTFFVVAAIGLALMFVAIASPTPPPERPSPGATRRALADPAFALGLWLNTLPAIFFGVLALLAPLTLSARGYGAFEIGAVFLVAGVLESVLNPYIGRLADSRGTLLPIRVFLVASIATGTALALTVNDALVVVFIVLASIAYGALFTPGMALVSERADRSELSQGLAFGVMNGAWALGQVIGSPVAGALSGASGDTLSYLSCSLLCAATLAVTATRGVHRRAAV
jgi:MFS family permease